MNYRADFKRLLSLSKEFDIFLNFLDPFLRRISLREKFSDSILDDLSGVAVSDSLSLHDCISLIVIETVGIHDFNFDLISDFRFNTSVSDLDLILSLRSGLFSCELFGFFGVISFADLLTYDSSKYP